jgi:hypothetical protein
MSRMMSSRAIVRLGLMYIITQGVHELLALLGGGSAFELRLGDFMM